jgi:UrcA family protein
MRDELVVLPQTGTCLAASYRGVLVNHSRRESMTYPAIRHDPGSRWKSVLAVLAGGLAVTAANAAGASAADSDVPTVVVQYTTTSLATDSGARAVYHHLAKAAEEVCENQHLVDTPFPSERELKCRQKALTTAVEKIHNPRLAAISAGNSKSG